MNQAQQTYVAAYIKANLPQYAALPVLSVSAPFKSGFQGGADYTDVAVGPAGHQQRGRPLPVPNTRVRGEGERCGHQELARSRCQTLQTRSTRQDHGAAAHQHLPGYNFDMFTTADVQYEIDVTQPVGSRIKNLTYLGKPSMWRRSS